MNWQQELANWELPQQRPTFCRPMLATASHDGGDGIFERKVDGFRIQAVADGAPRLYSRSGKDVTDRFPVRGLPQGRYVLDGEAVAMQGDRDDFGAVQRGRATHLVFFDILNLDGVDVRRLPWRLRRPLLNEVPLTEPCVRLPSLPGTGDVMLARACEAGWEGLVAKDPDAPYRSGRQRSWRKLKCSMGQEFVIGGYTEPRGGRIGFGALLLGHYDGARLLYAGKVGTGFDDATLIAIGNELARRSRASSPFHDGPPKAHWVEPELVCQVDFTEWTAGGRLRHPRFLGLRDDKPAAEVVLET